MQKHLLGAEQGEGHSGLMRRGEIPCRIAGIVGLRLSPEHLLGHGRELSPWEGLVEEWGGGRGRLLRLEICWASLNKISAKSQFMR